MAGIRPEDQMPDRELLVRENIGWMLPLAQRTLGNHRDLAEDAVQNAFMSAFRSLDKLEDPSKLTAWLHRITVNSALMELRRQRRQAEQPIDDLLPEFDHNDCRLEERWSYLARTEDVIENHQLGALITSSLEQIPETYRVVLHLRDIEGYSTSEVARLLEMTPSNVKIRLHRARSAMKKLIEPLLRGETN
jgi:RNA polymerase sigma-70 factor (ECF subfamily)